MVNPNTDDAPFFICVKLETFHTNNRLVISVERYCKKKFVCIALWTFPNTVIICIVYFNEC